MSIRTGLLVFLCALSSCGSPGKGEDRGGRFRSAWPEDVTRTWVGPEYHANRLQDWRVADGRLECTIADETRPVRTLHLLTARLSAERGNVTAKVRTGPIDQAEAGLGASSRMLAGFLIGTGGAGTDYRLSALAHHRPAEDGGILALVNGAGRVVFRDFEHNEIGGGWGITGRLHADELAEIPATSRDVSRPGRPYRELELVLRAEPAGSTYTLTLVARDPESGEVVSRASLEGVDPDLVEGGIALVSHLGPGDSRAGSWFRDWRVSGSKVVVDRERAFGPVLCAQYTVSRGVLKLTAQMPPLGDDDVRTARLELKQGKKWRSRALANLEPDANVFAFRLDDWAPRGEVPYRVVYELNVGSGRTEKHVYKGLIRREPIDEDSFVLAALTCVKHFTGGIRWNHDAIWFPHTELVEAVRAHDPDLVFFSGDQVYEGDISGAQRAPIDAAVLDYLDKWYRWCWSFRELVRDRPSITIPDDHDVYHGNLWGAGGRRAEKQDDGGYRMPARFVRMVERTQTSHLPDPFDPTPVEQGIGVYYTGLDYGGVSFAILEDRKFKSSATPLVPEGKVVNGWFQNPDFDPALADVPGAVLLGPRQLRFLSEWAADWSGGTWMKVALSQTTFANVATIPEDAESGSVLPGLEYPPPGEIPAGYKLAADTDSNGWPQSGRNRALRELRKAFALHVSGDQHLGSFVHHGIDAWEDAGYGFCVPAIANTWPRRWFPPAPGEERVPGSPLYTGRYLDGFGNRMTVQAVSNPVQSGREPAALHDRVPGYGIVRFHRESREIDVECWPRWVDPSRAGAKQYRGWPITIRQADNYAREAVAHLPTLVVKGLENPVLQVIEEARGEILYTVRMAGERFRPKVFALGRYTLRIGEPGTDDMRELTGIEARTEDQGELRIDFL